MQKTCFYLFIYLKFCLIELDNVTNTKTYAFYLCPPVTLFSCSYTIFLPLPAFFWQGPSSSAQTVWDFTAPLVSATFRRQPALVHVPRLPNSSLFFCPAIRGRRRPNSGQALGTEPDRDQLNYAATFPPSEPVGGDYPLVILRGLGRGKCGRRASPAS